MVLPCPLLLVCQLERKEMNANTHQEEEQPFQDTRAAAQKETKLSLQRLQGTRCEPNGSMLPIDLSHANELLEEDGNKSPNTCAHQAEPRREMLTWP